jgi:DNA topoisomerase I
VTHLDRLQQTGIRRLGTPKSGFRYVTADGRKPDAATLERIDALRIPPAWTDVYVNPSPRGDLQAIGKDKAGRWQYRYHPRFTERQARRKYERVIDFAEALPKMRAAVERDLRRPGLGREKVMACILKVLSNCFIRPGSQAYADENGSYGIATLRNEHVTVHGDVVHFSFPGKSGKQQERDLHDPLVACIVRRLLKTPGREVFKYVDPDGNLVDVRRRDINQYIKEVMGDRFSAKDFRTWAGTLITASALARAGRQDGDSNKARKKKVVSAVKEAAAVLGNTPAICRASYIYPSVLSSFDRGRTIAKYFHNVEELIEHRRPTLHASEKALLELLRDEAVEATSVIPARARRRSRVRQVRAGVTPGRASGADRVTAPQRRRLTRRQ